MAEQSRSRMSKLFHNAISPKFATPDEAAYIRPRPDVPPLMLSAAKPESAEPADPKAPLILFQSPAVEAATLEPITEANASERAIRKLNFDHERSALALCRIA